MCHLAVLFLQDDSSGRLDGFWRQFAEIYDDFGCRGQLEASDDLAVGCPSCGALVADHVSVSRLIGVMSGILVPSDQPPGIDYQAYIPSADG